MRLKSLIPYFSLFILIASCQNISDIDYSDNTSAKSLEIQQNGFNTLERLQAINDSLMETVEVNDFNYKKFRDAIDIAWADAYGGYRGARCGWYVGSFICGPNGGAIGAAVVGPIVAAAKSYNKAQEIKNKTRSLPEITLDDCIAASVYMLESTPDYEQYYPKMMRVPIPEESQECELMGVKHNLILDNLVNERLSSSTINTVYSMDQCKILLSEHTKKFFDEGTTDLSSMQSPSFDEILADDIMTKYKQAIERTTSYEKLERISNIYINEIKKDRIMHDKEKDDLYTAISVMISTAEYWKIFDDSEQQ